MTAFRVRWLPLGHIAHGYRRVFIVEDNDAVQKVIVLSPMPYESVYQVKQRAPGTEMRDPSLWWGMSLVHFALQNPKTFETSDDGYVTIRPGHLEDVDLLPIEQFTEAVRTQEITVQIEQMPPGGN